MTARTEFEDALSPRMAGSTEGMTLQVLAQIRDSLTGLSRDVRSANEATADVRERVIRLEERDKRLDAVEVDLAAVKVKVEVLETDRARRQGAIGMLGTIKSWAPFLAMLFSAACVLWLYGRSAGIVPAPPAPAIEQRRQSSTS